MTKLIIDGTYLFYSILELKNEDALFLQSIMEKELVTYDQIFFERKDFKKLGFKKLEDISVVAHFSGFQSNSIMSMKPVGVMTIYHDKKKVFASTLDRLETKYHLGLYKELCDVYSSIRSEELKFKKRRGYKYFFLKGKQSSKFTMKYDDRIPLNHFLFEQVKLFSSKSAVYSTQLVNILVDDSIIPFKCNKKSIVSIESIK
jgi:hypothetical protein